MSLHSQQIETAIKSIPNRQKTQTLWPPGGGFCLLSVPDTNAFTRDGICPYKVPGTNIQKETVLQDICIKHLVTQFERLN
jgi:hypothetical protein